MPFTKVGKDDYTSPSGRHFNSAQVRLYHANGDKFPGQKTSEGAMSNKGYMGKTESYAAGGEVLGRTKDFMKTPDRFRESRFGSKAEPETEDNFGKSGGKNEAPKARDKSLAPVKPRK